MVSSPVKLPILPPPFFVSAPLVHAENIDAEDCPRVFETPDYEAALQIGGQR